MPGEGATAERRVKEELHRGEQTQTVGYLVLRVCCSRHFVWCGLGSGVLHANYRGGGDCVFGFYCSSARVCPRDGIAYHRHRVVRGQGSSGRSR